MKTRAVFAFLLFILCTFAEEYNPFSGLFPTGWKTIAVVAPASPPASLEKLDQAIDLLRKAGYTVKEMPHVRDGKIGKSSPIAPEKRKADFEAAWLDKENDVILCVRGGKGSENLVPLLDWEKLRSRPDMPVLGFSNITALHLAMLKEKAGHPYCSPSLASIMRTGPECLKASAAVYAGKSPEPVRLTVLKPGKAEGLPVAGHLFLLEYMSKTDFFPDVNGKILFIECTAGDASRIRNALKTLEDKGIIRQCSAVVFGRLNGAKKEEIPIMQEFARRVPCPVFSGFPYSHTKRNQAIDLWKKIIISEDGILLR